VYHEPQAPERGAGALPVRLYPVGVSVGVIVDDLRGRIADADADADADG
jgi:hypothetical protein